MNTSPQKRLRGRQAADFICQDVHQLGLSIRTAVGQGALEVIPNAFIRVQFRGVRWNRCQVQTGRAGEKLLHGIATVNLAIIQQNDQMAVYLMQQMAEKRRYFFALEIVLIELAVQRTMETLRTDGDARDSRDAVVTIPMTQDRRLSHRAPRLTDRRDQEEARFVDKDEMGCQPCGVFFTRGQTDRFHSAMAVSSRSMARRSGFWWLQPSWYRSLPT